MEFFYHTASLMGILLWLEVCHLFNIFLAVMIKKEHTRINTEITLITICKADGHTICSKILLEALYLVLQV